MKGNCASDFSDWGERKMTLARLKKGGLKNKVMVKILIPKIQERETGPGEKQTPRGKEGLELCLFLLLEGEGEAQSGSFGGVVNQSPLSGETTRAWKMRERGKIGRPQLMLRLQGGKYLYGFGKATKGRE